MADRKLLTFSIMTYKKFDGIFDTLKSLFLQDYPRIELIISDDGSPNYHDEIDAIKDYIENNKRNNIENVIYSHMEKNQGTVHNVNNAIGLSHGYYLKFLGCDDTLIASDALTRYVDFLEESECSIVFAKMIGVTPDGELVKHLASCEEDYDLLRSMSPEQLCNRLYARNCLPAPAWCIKRELFDRNGLFPEEVRLIEDYPYWIRLCHNNEKIAFMDDVLIKYKLNGVSSAGNYGVMFMEDMFAIYDSFIFPYDKRYGIFQPVYNQLKRMGLEAYMVKAKWSGYSNGEKAWAYLKYGLFFCYINYENEKINRKNRKEENMKVSIRNRLK